MNVYIQSRFKQNPSDTSHTDFQLGQSGSRTNLSTSIATVQVQPRPNTSNGDDTLHKLASPTRAPPPPPEVPPHIHSNTHSEGLRQEKQEISRSMFRPLENYIIACFSSIECLNSSFLTSKPPSLVRAASESSVVETGAASRPGEWDDLGTPFPEIDAKTLLLGDFAENGTWWAGKTPVERYKLQQSVTKVQDEKSSDAVNAKSPRINWSDLNEWYHAVLSVGRLWRSKTIGLEAKNSLGEGGDAPNSATRTLLQQFEEDATEASMHVQRTLLKVSENILRRPGRPLKRPGDCRFLLILLANPLLSSSESGPPYPIPIKYERSASEGQQTASKPQPASLPPPSMSTRRSPSTRGGSAGKHSGIIKRILGLLSNLPNECHQHLVNWFSRFTESHFRRLVDLIGSFVSYRLSRQHGRKRSSSHDPAGFLIPSITGPGAGTSAQLHAALGAAAAPKSPEKSDSGVAYAEDWQIKAAAKIMSLLFAANNHDSFVRLDNTKKPQTDVGRTRTNSGPWKGAHRQRPLVAINAFYNTLLDYSDLIADFETWESRRGKFSFCQYPMFLSIWAKIRIMEHDARRQMEIQAREAFFNSIMSRKAINQYLVLKVRRDCLVEDSLRGVSEVVGTGQEEIKKGLRIDFVGEEGLDSGGLRKEWFLLLVREIFDPEHGLFVYDEDSHYCYFNPNTFETSDQFFLVGVLLGLAIYNSTILDVALPPFAFRKLLASAPNYTGPTTSSSRPATGYTLEDLAEFRPSLAQGLRQLLEYNGDVETTFCRDFVAVVERYGQFVDVPLCPKGETRPVNNANRREFVDLYVRYLLDTSVSRQYEPFKRGFFTVCGGNALSLFRPEEIELLVRGSDESLDVATLRTVAIYDGWGRGVDAPEQPVIKWFWEAFANANAKDQRKLLSFITASDRIPAMGATSLVIKIACLGDHCERFPIARTCFNMLALYRYQTREVLQTKLWRAVIDSEGFGMK